MKQNIISIITWTDSVGCASGWVREDSIQYDSSDITTIGCILREDQDWLTIAPTFYTGKDDAIHAMGVVTIPKRSITERREFDISKPSIMARTEASA